VINVLWLVGLSDNRFFLRFKLPLTSLNRLFYSLNRSRERLVSTISLRIAGLRLFPKITVSFIILVDL
jgi:hypothetical protein